MVLIFNAILLTHHFPTMWKHARVISILKPGKDSPLPSSYRPISLLDTIGKLFEKILLARILHEVSVRGLMLDEKFGFRPRHSTSLQLARLVARITTNRKKANRRSIPRRGQSLPYRLDRWPPLKANTHKFPVLPSPHDLIVLPGSDVRSVLPDGHVISSRHVGWGGSGWIDSRPLKSVCQHHALTLAPSRVSPLRG